MGKGCQIVGNESKSAGKWLKIMGKWSRILWGIASTAKLLHPGKDMGELFVIVIAIAIASFLTLHYQGKDIGELHQPIAFVIAI